MIKQAIIPLAGLGTRLLPLTSFAPKELLPINGKPILQYLLDECIEAGIKEIILIVSLTNKKIIKDYYFNDFIYKEILKKKDKRIIKEYRKILKYRKLIKFAIQNKPTGTADAVLKTKKFIKSDFFLMLLADDLIIKKNCSKSMILIHKKYNSSVIASMIIKKKDVSRYGICKVDYKLSNTNFLIHNVIEKPTIKNSPSNKAIIGRYILPKKIFDKIKSQKKGVGGETHITDTIKSLISDNNKFVGHLFEGEYLDCGTMKNYIKSSLKILK
jgi:UTP--glucose-1-phosphate uridylyltransferase